MASSGITSLFLPGGETSHSVFKIPLQPNETLACSFNKRSEHVKSIHKTMLIMWGEASMMNRLVFK